MNVFKKLRTLFLRYFLLGAISALIILALLGSANIFLVSESPRTLTWALTLFLSVATTMSFMALFLAQFPKSYIFSAFIFGMIIQLVVFVLICLNLMN